MRSLLIVLISTFLGSFPLSAQELYNNCSDALELCPYQVYSVNNIGANVTVCPNCEDDFAFCFMSQNSIWFTFTTNAMGGDIQIDFTNLVFETNVGQDMELQATILQAGAPCDASTYNQIGNCVANATANFTLNAVGLNPSTTYYVVVDGDNTGGGILSPAECSFDIVVSGGGIIRPTPSIDINPPSATVCLSETVTFDATTNNCPDNGDFQWFIDGVLVATTSTPLFQTSALQQGNVVTVQTSCYTLCAELTTDATAPITVNSFPIDAGPDQTIQLGDAAVLGGITTAPSFQWTPTFNVSNPSNLNPVVTPTGTTTYTLTATQGGCTLSDQATVFVESELEIPNSFSPNDDGANDTWEIDGAELYSDASMHIYTRWGQSVFQSRGYSNEKAWDGANERGKPMAEGVYYYVFELNDSDEQVFKGSVTLIR